MIKKKILAGLMAINFAFMGLGLYNPLELTPVAYAQEDEASKFDQQKAQLQLAIDDSINVISSEVYTTLTSENLKADYLGAIDYAKNLMADLTQVSYNDLRDATIRINDAKNAIGENAKLQLAIKKLEAAIEDNQYNASAARMLLDNYPETVKNIREDLLVLLDKSNKLVESAKALLAQYK
ncbi:MAG: hypothetical protein Q4D88_05420 [Anaerococcus sp.]|nr:hypothetical protein [Anaerococcus sp.]